MELPDKGLNPSLLPRKTSEDARPQNISARTAHFVLIRSSVELRRPDVSIL